MEYIKIREARTELFSIIRGIELRIFKGEIALNLFIEINKYHQLIASSEFGNLFFSLKVITLDNMINCICGLFDSYKDYYRYRVQSIPRALHFIESKKKELEIKDRKLLLKKLNKYNIDVDTIKNILDEQLTQFVIEHFEYIVPKSLNQNKDDIKKFFGNELNSAFYTLQTLRDKKVSHFEDTYINTPDDQTIKDAKLLIEFSKSFVDIIGNGFLGYDYSREETYPRKKQAENFSKDLSMLLKKANIIA